MRVLDRIKWFWFWNAFVFVRKVFVKGVVTGNELGCIHHKTRVLKLKFMIFHWHHSSSITCSFKLNFYCQDFLDKQCSNRHQNICVGWEMKTQYWRSLIVRKIKKVMCCKTYFFSLQYFSTFQYLFQHFVVGLQPPFPQKIIIRPTPMRKISVYFYKKYMYKQIRSHIGLYNSLVRYRSITGLC